MIFVNDDEVLLVDALASQRDGEALRDFVTNDLGKSVRMVVCTHYFSDHLAALKLFPKSQIIAHKNYRHTFDAERYRSEDERAHFVEPDMLVSDELQMRWGRYTLDIFHNPGHTMSTLAIDVPEADLILIGDTIVGNIVYIMYTAPQMFFPALECIKRRGRSRLLSCHMGVRSSDAVNHATHYLKELETEVLAARRNSNKDEAILSIALDACLAPGLKGTEFENRFHKRNLESIIERNLWTV
jgi:glyoxylase-like metal-dependent hydrolase (beta-lactamase superfamily II)